MIEFGAFLLSPSPSHIRGGGAASSYIWIVGLPIIEMVTTRVWERGGHARGGARELSRGHRALSPQQVVTWRPLATTPPPAPRQGGNNYRGRALTHLHLHTLHLAATRWSLVPLETTDQGNTDSFEFTS